MSFFLCVSSMNRPLLYEVEFPWEHWGGVFFVHFRRLPDHDSVSGYSSMPEARNSHRFSIGARAVSSRRRFRPFRTTPKKLYQPTRPRSNTKWTPRQSRRVPDGPEPILPLRRSPQTSQWKQNARPLISLRLSSVVKLSIKVRPSQTKGSSKYDQHDQDHVERNHADNHATSTGFYRPYRREYHCPQDTKIS